MDGLLGLGFGFMEVGGSPRWGLTAAGCAMGSMRWCCCARVLAAAHAPPRTLPPPPAPGSITPRPQPGNPKPRVFRLSDLK
jgi:hypothetical protein